MLLFSLFFSYKIARVIFDEMRNVSYAFVTINYRKKVVLTKKSISVVSINERHINRKYPLVLPRDILLLISY